MSTGTVTRQPQDPRRGRQTSGFRRVAAILTIGSFSVAALMGIVALIGGGDFSENDGRVLLTTLIVGCASICVLSDLATAGTRWWPVGLVGGVVVLLPVVTALWLVWAEWGGDASGLRKAFGIGVVLAVTFAQLCLLLALAGEGRLGAVLWPTVAVAVLVAILLSVMILQGVDDNEWWRMLGILAILDVFGTLVTIALAKFGDRGAARDGGGRLRVTLDEDRTAALQELAHNSGRPPEELVAEAVDRLLGP
jgi:F0F1-type ATP synthase assembly protein I